MSDETRDFAAMVGPVMTGEAEAMLHRNPDGTFTCPHHNAPMDERPDPDGNPAMRIAVCPVCEANAAQIRGALEEAFGHVND